MHRRHSPSVSEQARAELLAIRGVVSVGIGADAEGAPALIVGVRADTARVRRALPERVEGLPVIVHEVGDLGARESSTR